MAQRIATKVRYPWLIKLALRRPIPHMFDPLTPDPTLWHVHVFVLLAAYECSYNQSQSRGSGITCRETRQQCLDVSFSAGL